MGNTKALGTSLTVVKEGADPLTLKRAEGEGAATTEVSFACRALLLFVVQGPTDRAVLPCKVDPPRSKAFARLLEDYLPRDPRRGKGGREMHQHSVTTYAGVLVERSRDVKNDVGRNPPLKEGGPHCTYRRSGDHTAEVSIRFRLREGPVRGVPQGVTRGDLEAGAELAEGSKAATPDDVRVGPLPHLEVQRDRDSVSPFVHPEIAQSDISQRRRGASFVTEMLKETRQILIAKDHAAFAMRIERILQLQDPTNRGGSIEVGRRSARQDGSVAQRVPDTGRKANDRGRDALHAVRE